MDLRDGQKTLLGKRACGLVGSGGGHGNDLVTRGYDDVALGRRRRVEMLAAVESELVEHGT